MTSEFTIAVHALVFLNHKAQVYSSEGLAENVCTNAARIRKVMAKLKKADLAKPPQIYIFTDSLQNLGRIYAAKCVTIQSERMT